MGRLGGLIFLFFLLLASLGVGGFASAHQNGCHRWHSCPSDTGSYVCGDLGYTTFCPTIVPEIPSKMTQDPPIVPQPVTATTPVDRIGTNILDGTVESILTIPKAKKTSCKIKGNVTHNGKTVTKIYHLPGGKYYKATKIKTSEGDRWFCSEKAAKKAGFRKSKR